MMYFNAFVVILLLQHEVRGGEIDTVKSLAALVARRIKEEAINAIPDSLAQNVDKVKTMASHLTQRLQEEAIDPILDKVSLGNADTVKTMASLLTQRIQEEAIDPILDKVTFGNGDTVKKLADLIIQRIKEEAENTIFDRVSFGNTDTITTLATILAHKIKEEAVNTIPDALSLVHNADAALRYMADTVVTTTLLGCLKLIPNTVNIPPLDLNLNLGGPCHFFADNGRLHGLSTVKVQSSVYEFNDDGNLLIKFPVTYTDLHIVYERFEFNCWPVVMTGRADLKFTDSEVNINIMLIKPSHLLERITNRECIFHVGSLQFPGFHEMEPNITVDGDKGHKFLYDHVFPVVAAEIKKVMLHMVDLRVTNSLYDYLPERNSWVCRDPNLKRLKLRTTGIAAFRPAGAANWLPAFAEDQDIDKESYAQMPVTADDQHLVQDTGGGNEDTDFNTPLDEFIDHIDFQLPDIVNPVGSAYGDPIINIHQYDEWD